MTDRVQTIRSNVTGSRPSGQRPGTLYVNWADGQLGSITPSGAPQDLVGVRFFSPNASYSQGDHVIEAGVLYYANSNLAPAPFDVSEWTQVGALSAGYLPLSGGAMNGPLTLAGNPVNPLDAATKNYVDQEVAAGGGGGGGGGGGPNPNLLINGSMRIAQLSVGQAYRRSDAADYVVDRWYAGNNAGYPGLEIGQNLIGAGNPTLPPGFSTFLGAVVIGGPYSVGGTDTFVACQWIEADVLTNLMWGTPTAKPLTLSFWVWSSSSGTWSVAIHNAARTRSYVIPYAPTFATWTLISVTIPGDTGGTWTPSGNGIGMIVNFCYGCGSILTVATGNLWTNGKYYATQQSNILPEMGSNSLLITGAKLEVGTTFTGFYHKSLSEQLLDCQRYYAKSYNQSEQPGAATPQIMSSLIAYNGGAADSPSQIGYDWRYPVTMRAAPAILQYSPQTGALNNAALLKAGGDIALNAQPRISDNSCYSFVNGGAIAAHELVAFHLTANAELIPTF
jgi:hypothetical protein